MKNQKVDNKQLTPKQKAKQLIDLVKDDILVSNPIDDEPYFANMQSCATTIVDEVLAALSGNYMLNSVNIRYYQKVRLEISKLKYQE